MGIGPCDWHVIDERLVVSSIQKNASTALTTAFPHRIGAEQALEYPVRLAWIRSPLMRIRSVYCYVRGKEEDEVTAWHNFVDYILIPENVNVHWVPQMDRLYFEEKLVPNKFERFEKIGKKWQDYCTKKLPYSNGSEPLFTDKYREEDLIKMYKRDLKVWETI